MNKGILLALLSVAIMLIVGGIGNSQFLNSDVSRFFRGAPTNKAIWLLLGMIVLGIVGLFSLLSASKSS